MKKKNLILLLLVIALVGMSACSTTDVTEQAEMNETIVKDTTVVPTAVPSASVSSSCYENGFCTTGETYASCPSDCIETCGDGIVQDQETMSNCKTDIVSQCGDGVCQEWEHYRYCAVDCDACILDDYDQYDGENECPPSLRWDI